ncbi:hypothetical protein [Micromonospora sp. WMMD975]|uniref:hypothetical protein n=1 Tax=Micromonospora sp. WMMD975 TaxID=3016087 RepID=UPI00249A5267|nr:hypothetical protein [Micromonospora sp. WMMD975]WFE31663.1 hypothetical protein O7613_18840 [Micromonospora sp. WMMD975]
MRDDRATRRRHRDAVAGLRGGGRGEPLIAAPRRAAVRPPRFFTVHLGFAATDATVARELAVSYAEALGLLRPELALGAAALSPADAWHRAERLFCGAVGPDGERCADVADHPGFHHAPGPGGLGWGDGD